MEDEYLRLCSKCGKPIYDYGEPPYNLCEECAYLYTSFGY